MMTHKYIIIIIFIIIIMFPLTISVHRNIPQIKRKMFDV